jgi:hypothetical protein
MDKSRVWQPILIAGVFPRRRAVEGNRIAALAPPVAALAPLPLLKSSLQESSYRSLAQVSVKGMLGDEAAGVVLRVAEDDYRLLFSRWWGTMTKM